MGLMHVCPGGVVALAALVGGLLGGRDFKRSTAKFGGRFRRDSLRIKGIVQTSWWACFYGRSKEKWGGDGGWLVVEW